jgi:glycosyltransferase involved in cell wall biosynthesis
LTRRVFFFTDGVELGGAERALLLLIENLDRDRWQSTLLFHPSDAVAPLVERARELGVAIRPTSPLPLGARGAVRAIPLALRMRRDRPDVFHAHLSWPLAAKYALVSAVLARIPAIVATVQLFPEFQLDRSNYVQGRLLAARVGRYVAVSEDIATKLAGRLGVPPAKIRLIQNGAALDRTPAPFDAALRNLLSGGSERPVVFTAARLASQKGLDVLLQAASGVPGARFVIAGAGPERARLESDAKALGVAERVLLLGHRSDVAALLAASDVFVLPSLYEGTSLALLEAMAAGKPVVASDIGGTNELIQNGTSGLLVPPGDADRLALAVRRVLADPDLGQRLGTAARLRARTEFSVEAKAEQIAAVYEELLERNSARSAVASS